MKTIKKLSYAILIICMPFLAASQTVIEKDESVSNNTYQAFEKKGLKAPASKLVENTDIQKYYTELGTQLYSAYKLFRLKKIDSVKLILKQSGFNEVDIKSFKIQPRGTVDSLVFGSPDKSKIILVIVDLGYLHDVSVIMEIKTDDPAQVLKVFENLMRKDQLTADEDFCIPSICAVFQSQGEFWVVDDRWKERTHTRFESLYHHLMSVYETSFIVNFSETVPKKWVTEKEVIEYELAMRK